MDHDYLDRHPAPTPAPLGRTYRKRPVTVEALFYDGRNDRDLLGFVGSKDLSFDSDGHPQIKTLEGTMAVRPGDYVIRGVKGEFYPCKGDIFGQTYEPAEVRA